MREAKLDKSRQPASRCYVAPRRIPGGAPFAPKFHSTRFMFLPFPVSCKESVMKARINGRLLGCGAAMAGLVAAGVALAQVQNPQPPQQPGQQQPGQQRAARPNTQVNLADSQLAGWLLVDNHGEVALARLAQQKATGDDVKKFATKMVEDHTKFIDRLQPFASEQARAQAGQPRNQAGTQPARPGGGLDIVELKQRLGQKCLESARIELEKKDGDKFDHCYAGQQAMMHMMMLDTLEVFRNFASPELRPVLEEGIRTTEEHLKEAKELAESKMDHRSSAQASRDEESRKQ
jgi:predicted outer membrane protein